MGEPWIERREIGPCTMYLGNALDIMIRLDAESVDMVFTDPPYGHNNNNNGDLIHRREVALGRSSEIAESNPIANDGPEANNLYRAALVDMSRLLRAPGCCCCCGGGGPDPQFARWALWMDAVFKFKQQVVWDKGKMGMGWHYRRSYEVVLIGEKRGSGKAAWYDTSRKVENVIRPGDYGIKKIIPRKDQHPTEKPWQLAAHFIGLHSQPGALVLDPFMGAGSTGDACIRTGRRFIGIEIDPAHYATACARIERAVSELGG